MVRTKQTRLIRCLLYGYKRAKGLAGNICDPYRKLWTGKLTNQSSRYNTTFNTCVNSVLKLFSSSEELEIFQPN